MASEETSVYADLKYVDDSSKQVIKISKTMLTLAVSCKAIILPLATILLGLDGLINLSLG